MNIYGLWLCENNHKEKLLLVGLDVDEIRHISNKHQELSSGKLFFEPDAMSSTNWAFTGDGMFDIIHTQLVIEELPQNMQHKDF